MLLDPLAPQAVEVAGCTLTHILTTHHHHDHAGGNWELCKRVQQRQGRKLIVVGGKNDNVPACTLPVVDGQSCAPAPRAREKRALHHARAACKSSASLLCCSLITITLAA